MKQSMPEGMKAAYLVSSYHQSSLLRINNLFHHPIVLHLLQYSICLQH
jgi:hypothetical protein